MTVHWLIDGDMFNHYRDDLIEAIREQGGIVQLIHPPRPPYRWDDVESGYRDTFPDDACVIAHGDIELVTRIQREKRWNPGAFCSVDNFRCSSYLCRLGKYWVNSFCPTPRIFCFLSKMMARDEVVP